jgi:hypothetical protein
MSNQNWTITKYMIEPFLLLHTFSAHTETPKNNSGVLVIHIAACPLKAGIV